MTAVIGLTAGFASRVGAFRSIPRALVAGLVIGLLAGATSVPIVLALFGGVTASGTGIVTSRSARCACRSSRRHSSPASAWTSSTRCCRARSSPRCSRDSRAALAHGSVFRTRLRDRTPPQHQSTHRGRRGGAARRPRVRRAATNRTTRRPRVRPGRRRAHRSGTSSRHPRRGRRGPDVVLSCRDERARGAGGSDDPRCGSRFRPGSAHTGGVDRSPTRRRRGGVRLGRGHHAATATRPRACPARAPGLVSVLARRIPRCGSRGEAPRRRCSRHSSAAGCVSPAARLLACAPRCRSRVHSWSPS